MEVSKRSVLWHIKQLHQPVFTTHQLSVHSAKSTSNVTQALNHLEKEEIITKLYRGLWAENDNQEASPYAAIEQLFPRQRLYVSFTSALHLHGIITQAPLEITLASTAHTKTIQTKLATFSIHQISPVFFAGFSWYWLYKQMGNFLIAEPEKALIDSLYLSTRKKGQFTHLPELHFPHSFSFQKAEQWTNKIPEQRIRTSVQRKLTALL